jgi:hypothetical protein
MAFPLALIPLLISAGVSTAQAIAKNAPTAADKRNKQKLNELLELEGKRGLGLTGQDQRVAEARTEMPMAQQLSAQMAEQNRALAAGGANVGAALAAGQQMADTGALARQQSISDIEALDLQKKQAQLQEIEKRTAFKAMRQREKRQATIDAFGEVGQAGTGLFSQGLTTQGPAAMGIGGGATTAKGKPMSPEQQELLTLMQENPELFNSIINQGK